jgi:hypothetical protein
MQTPSAGSTFKFVAVTVLILLAGTSAATAQEVSMALLQPALMQPAPAPLAASVVPSNPRPQPQVEHRFWDRENTVLFATVAGFSAADFAVTRDNLSHGGRELNPLTRPFTGSTAALAANFAGETAGVIGVSYWFHKTGHHNLERLTPLVNFGASAFAVGYGLAHR